MNITRAHVARILRNAARNPNIHQTRNSFGNLDANNNGAACATTIIGRFVDEYPDPQFEPDAFSEALESDIGFSRDEIIGLNDAQGLTLDQIADRIEFADA